MSNANVDKGRSAESAVAAFLSVHGFPYVERRAKRGGYVDLDCLSCTGHGYASTPPIPGGARCLGCGGTGSRAVPADAGDLTGIPGVVVQVKWSPYKPLAEDMRRTEEQRRAGRADVGLLVRKRKGVGLARAGEWDAYLPEWAVSYLLSQSYASPPLAPDFTRWTAPWHTDLATAAALIRRAGYGANNLETTA